nr:SDR family NAD(P)-dependent oxidoreductase [Phytohabitans suffuscus]
MSLNGKIAIVTGAAGGIGSAISRELHAQGASVAIADLRADAAKHLAEELNTLRPGSAIAVGVDISSTEDAAAAVDAVRSGLGEVDILVNNAGIDKIERFTDSTPDSWRKIIDVNLLGTITMTRAVLDPMLERGSGRLINIASDAGRVGSSGRWCTQPPKVASSRSPRRWHERSRPRVSHPTAFARGRPTRLCSARSPNSARSSTKVSAAPSRCAGSDSPSTSHRLWRSWPATAPPSSPAKRCPSAVA